MDLASLPLWATHLGVPVRPDPIGSSPGQVLVPLDLVPQPGFDQSVDRFEEQDFFVGRPLLRTLPWGSVSGYVVAMTKDEVDSRRVRA